MEVNSLSLNSSLAKLSFLKAVETHGRLLRRRRQRLDKDKEAAKRYARWLKSLTSHPNNSNQIASGIGPPVHTFAENNNIHSVNIKTRTRAGLKINGTSVCCFKTAFTMNVNNQSREGQFQSIMEGINYAIDVQPNPRNWSNFLRINPPPEKRDAVVVDYINIDDSDINLSVPEVSSDKAKLNEATPKEDNDQSVLIVTPDSADRPADNSVITILDNSDIPDERDDVIFVSESIATPSCSSQQENLVKKEARKKAKKTSVKRLQARKPKKKRKSKIRVTRSSTAGISQNATSVTIQPGQKEGGGLEVKAASTKNESSCAKNLPPDKKPSDKLREIVIDGSNVALGHSNGTLFSVKGLEIAINYFTNKGHKVTAFVPQYRLKSGQSSNPQLLQELNKKRLVVFTPSREIQGRRITPYDDRFIIEYATKCKGIVVSNDNFRDLLLEKVEWKDTIEKRILMYTWIDDVLMIPEDPLGRHGPTLAQFLKLP